MTTGEERALRARLLRWFVAHRRDFPWRRGKTPYRVFVSEVMLQQTTTDVVMRRFPEFIARFPDLVALAAASEDDVIAAWAGLGYYRRARMLRAAARVCVADHGARLPRNYDALRRLPGVGAYTAGAIASLGFGLRHAAVDGNVARAWSRFEAVHEGPAALAKRILRWIPDEDPGAFNEALIELGATTCRPVAPACDACPLASWCLAFERGEVERFPARKPRPATVAVVSARGVLRDRDGGVLVTRRAQSASLLAGQDELPGRWLAPGETPETALRDVFAELGFSGIRVGAPPVRARHAVTRHRIEVLAFPVAARGGPRGPSARFVPAAHLRGRAVTTETRKLTAAGVLEA